jgi:hypothetical protein
MRRFARDSFAAKEFARFAKRKMTEIWQENNTHTLWIKEKMYESKEKI